MSLSMGQIIKELRKKNGFTQEELANRLGVTYQAVSKWENESGMPDISQVVPLASVFGVSTDVLFGIAETTEYEEALEIVKHAESVEKYRDLETYLNAYDILLDGLKKYPNNLIIMNNCMNLGLSLSLPENGWIYAAERAEEIASETIRQANYITTNSKSVHDILRARQVLVFLYSSQGKFDLATNEARNFSPWPSFTLYSNMAMINEYMKNYKRAATYLCTDIDYTLQNFEDDIARLGKAYYNDGKYADAISVYEIFFEVIKVIFKDECPFPYHDFDSGDCYLLLAEAYLAVGENSKAMDAVENSVMYYIDLYNTHTETEILNPGLVKSPIVRESEIFTSLKRDMIKQRLLGKLSESSIQSLNQEARFIALLETVNNLS